MNSQQLLAVFREIETMHARLCELHSELGNGLNLATAAGEVAGVFKGLERRIGRALISETESQ